MLLNIAFAAVLSIGATAIPATASASPPFPAPRPIEADAWVRNASLEVRAAAPAATPLPRPAAALPSAALGVFGSMAISAARLPAAAKWQQARQTDYTALFSGDCLRSGLSGCDSRFATRIRAIAGRIGGLSDRAMLDLVNRTVNAAMTYRADKAIWGVGDYWATPTEMAVKGTGDCEDFAIAKYWALRRLGLSEDQLQLVLLQDTRRQLFHAVLVVHTSSGAYVLDNATNTLQHDTAYAQYQPIMSFSGSRSYIHGFTGGNTAVAAMPKDLSAVAPGLGM